MRTLPLLLALLVPATALADPTFDGTWSTEGTANGETFTGEVRVTPREGVSWYELYDVKGVYRFADREMTWKADGYAFGDKLYVWTTYDVPGIVGRIENVGQKQNGWGDYARDGDTMKGSWATYPRTANPAMSVSDTLTRSAGDDDPTGEDGGDGDETPLPEVVVDLQLESLAGVVVDEAAEDTTGYAIVHNIDDDDNDGGAGGHGQTKIVNDKDDTDGVTGEDDLVKLNVMRPYDAVVDGMKFRLKFGDALKVWRKADKTGPVTEATRLDPAASVTLYVEGVKATAGEAGTTITAELVKGDRVSGSDSVKAHVTRSAFILTGHGGSDYAVTSEARRRSVDRRRNPWVVRGKDGTHWAVYSWQGEKEAKIALSTEGSVIVYEGHSNYGMGFAFEEGFSTLNQFMNIAKPQIPVNWPYLRDHQSHSRLMFDKSEYGDDASTPEKYDPVGVPYPFRGALGQHSTTNYPLSGGVGTRRPLQPAGTFSRRYNDRHYGTDDNPRIIIKSGSPDMPEKNWSVLFLHSCYSGPYYEESFGGRGTLYYSLDSTYAASRTSPQVIFGTMDGRSEDDIVADMNQVNNCHDYKKWD